MIEPYRMVVVNIIASLVVCCILYLYLRHKPKNKKNYLLVILFISILPLISILRKGTYESGDLSLHATEAIEFYKSLQEGHIFPIWGGNLNATYGYPVFLFTYPLPHYIISFFHLISFGFIVSTKILLILAFIASGIGMYLFTFKLIKNTLGALTAGIFYLFAPYHLIDLHFRVDIGEILAFAFLPFILLSINSFKDSGRFFWLEIEIFLIAGLILSHQAISIALMPLLAVYIVFLNYHVRSNKYWLVSFTPIALGCLITAFYWLPVIYNLRFTYQSLFSEMLQFVSLHDLLFSPWRYGLLFQGPMGQLSFLIGYAQLLVISASLYLLYKYKIAFSDRKLLLLFLCLFFLYFFMMLDLSKPLWYTFPLIKNFQFAYRLLTIEALITSIIAGILVKNLRNEKLTILICSFAIFTTILNWGNRRNIPDITDAYLIRHLPSSTSEGEGLSQAITIWSDLKKPYFDSKPLAHLQVLEGKADIIEINRTTTNHEYLIAAKSTVRMRENTLYFPGWQLVVNNSNHTIYISKSFPKGIILFDLDKGNYNVKLQFVDSPIMKYGKLISLITLIVISIMLLKNRIRFWRQH